MERERIGEYDVLEEILSSHYVTNLSELQFILMVLQRLN